jgi:all-trans-retinol 13,14-reductase
MLFLFLGLKESPGALGFGTANYWIFNAYDHDQALQEQLAAPDTVINSCMLSFPSLKNHIARRHTAEIIIYADYDYFRQWQGQPWRKRKLDYYQLKEKIADRIIDFVESYYPGFKELIEYYELATPLTVEYFIASDNVTAGISINNFLAQVERVGFHSDQLSVQLLSPSVLHWTDNRYIDQKIG